MSSAKDSPVAVENPTSHTSAVSVLLVTLSSKTPSLSHGKTTGLVSFSSLRNRYPILRFWLLPCMKPTARVLLLELFRLLAAMKVTAG